MERTKPIIKITLYQSIHQTDIDDMMSAIASEFDQPISSKPNALSFVPPVYWVALDKNKVIGTVGLLLIHKELAILKMMMLSKNYRGKELGISTRLLQTAVNWCLANHISSLFLGTMEQFKAAQAFYIQNGFQKIAADQLPEGFRNNPLDTVFFKRVLRSK